MWKRKETSIEVVSLKTAKTNSKRSLLFAEAGIRFIFLIMAAFACIYWLVSMLKMKIDLKSIFFVICFLSFWFSCVFGKRKKTKYMLSLTFALTAGFIFIKNKNLVNGLAMLLNRISERVKKYYGSGIGDFEENQNIIDLQYIVGLIGFLIVLLMAYEIIRRKRRGILLFFSVLLLSGSLSIDCFPDIKAFLLWTIACLGLWVMDREYFSHFNLTFGIWSMGGMTILLIAASLWITPQIENYFVENHKRTMEFQKEIESRTEDFMLKTPFSSWNIFSGFTWYGKVESGVLNNSNPGRTGRTALTITVDEIPNENIYMRGFTGGIYDGDRWIEISDEDFNETVKNQWGVKKTPDYSGEELLKLPYDFMNTFSGLEDKGVFQIHFKEVNGNYAYLPYFTNIERLTDGFIEVKGDGITRRKKDKVTYESFLRYPLRDYDSSVLAASSSDMMFPSDERYEILRSYKDYVQQHYLYVPAEGMDQFKKISSELKYELYQVSLSDGIDNMKIAADFVREVLSNQCIYSTTLKPLPDGKDFIEYFFFEQKKGYCIHFASTGVLMFRQMGFPSRYVTGYVVRPSDFKKDGNRYTAEIPDGNAHAWAEIYDESFGWIPVETTPGYYGYGVEKKKNQATGIESLPEIEKEQEITVTPEVSEYVESERNINTDKKENNEEKNSTGKESLLFTGGFIFTGTAIIVLIVCLRRYYLVRKRIKKFTERNIQQSILNISYETYQMLRAAGYRKADHSSDEDYSKYIQKSFNSMGESDFISFVTLSQKAKFSKISFKNKDTVFCRRIYHKLEQDIYRGLIPVRKFWWRFIKCY